MNHKDQAVVLPAHAGAGTIRRLLATLTFLLGGFAAELARPLNCNLIHRPAAQRQVRRQEEST